MAGRRRTREALWRHCRTVPLFKRFYLILTRNIGCCAANQNISFNISCCFNWPPSDPGEMAKLNQNHCHTHNTNYIIMSQWFWHSHLRPLITSQQGTALTILALLKGTDAEIGCAWVQQHVKTFAEGFLSQVTFRDWSADQAKKNYQGLRLDEFFTLPRHAWTGSWRWNILLYITSFIIIYHYYIIIIILCRVFQKNALSELPWIAFWWSASMWWPGVDQRKPIHGNSESAFFGTQISHIRIWWVLSVQVRCWALVRRHSFNLRRARHPGWEKDVFLRQKIQFWS